MPSQFWEMTPWELACVFDGATERRHYEQETVAKMTADLINVHVAKGHRAKPEHYYRRPDTPREPATSEEFTEQMKRRVRECEE